MRLRKVHKEICQMKLWKYEYQNEEEKETHKKQMRKALFNIESESKLEVE